MFKMPRQSNKNKDKIRSVTEQFFYECQIVNVMFSCQNEKSTDIKLSNKARAEGYYELFQ